MVFKCSTQYVTTLENSAVATELEKSFPLKVWKLGLKSSFQSQSREASKNVQIIVWLHSFLMLVRSCSKSFKLVFISTWTDNFHMYKLGFKESEKPEIKFQTFAETWRKQQSSRKSIYFFIDCARAFDCVGQKKLRKILKEMGEPDHLTCLLRSLYVGQEVTVRTRHGATDWFKIGKGRCQGCISRLSPS